MRTALKTYVSLLIMAGILVNSACASSRSPGVFQIEVLGSDSQDVVGAKVYVDSDNIGNTNSNGIVLTRAGTALGIHEVKVKKGKCEFIKECEFDGLTVEIVLPCYPVPNPSIKKISNWLVGDLNEDGSVSDIEVKKCQELDIVSGDIYQGAKKNCEGNGPISEDWIVGDLNLNNKVSTREVTTMKELWSENLVNMQRCLDAINNWQNTGKEP